MSRVRIAVIATLLAAGAATATGTTAAALPPPPEDGAICGAWEPRGGAGDGYRRLCIDGSLYWYEYR